MEWFCQILCAIKDIHSKNIIHRDIKSQNIFLTKEGIIKIGDFGVSTQTSSCASTVVGTPFYLSPEIINGAQYDSKTDIWSLGVLLYELCVLEYPFKVPNNSLAALALKILKGKFTPIPKQYSSDLSKMVSSMLSVNPKSRPTIDQLMASRFVKNFVSKNALIQKAIAGTSFRIGDGPAKFELPLISKSNLKKQEQKLQPKRQIIEGSPLPDKKNGSAAPEKKTMRRPAVSALRKEETKERLSVQPPIKKEIQKRVVEVKPTQKDEARRPRRTETDLNRSDLDSRKTADDDAKKVQRKAEIEEMRKQMREDMLKKKRENKNTSQFEVQIFTAAGKAVIDGRSESQGDPQEVASLNGPDAQLEVQTTNNPRASLLSLERGLSTQSEHQVRRENGLYVMDMPLKKNSEFPRGRKAPEAKQPRLGKKEGKPEPTESAPVFETASCSDSPQKGKLGFGSNGFNSKFLDQKYSEEGIEIYIKGTPPAKKPATPVAEKSFQEGFRVKPVQSEQGSSRQSFMEIARQSEDLYYEPIPKSKSNVFVDSLTDSPAKADFLKSRSTVLNASPTKDPVFDTLSLQQSELQEQSSTKSEKTQKILRFVPSSNEKRSGPLARSSSKEGAVQAEQVEVEKLFPTPSPEPQTPRTPQKSSASKNSPSKKELETRELGGIEVRDSVLFESEENFANVIENVSKLDTKKRLQDQINSSYAIIEEKRYQIEKCMSEEQFTQAYNQIRATLKHDGNLDRFLENREYKYMGVDEALAIDIAGVVLLEANLEIRNLHKSADS